MQIIASFTGRGIDVHAPQSKQDQLHLVHNLVDGVRTGRTRWFTVLGHGVDVLGDVNDALERREVTWQEVAALTDQEPLLDVVHDNGLTDVEIEQHARSGRWNR